MSNGKKVHDDFALIPGAVSYNNNYNATKDVHPKQRTTELQQTLEDPGEEGRVSFRTLLTNFASTTTAHGVGRIAEGSSLLRRVMWFVVSAGFYAVMFWMCIQLVQRYLDKPVVSRMEMSFEESLDFPAVTICNLNMLKRTNMKNSRLNPVIQDMEKRRLDREMGKPDQRVNKTDTNTTEASIQNHIQTMESSKKESLLSKAKNSGEKEMLSNVEIDTSNLETKYLDVILKTIPEEELSNSGHNLNEMLKHCRWYSFSCKKGSLKALWRHFWHWKYGNCFVFNSGLAQNGSKVPVMKVDRAGPYSGLEMDIFIDQGEYTSLTDEAGVRVVLTDQSRMPFPFDEGFSVPTGFSTSVGVKKRYIQRVDPYLNNSCLDENKAGNDTYDIYGEKYHVNYSCQACRMSCLATKEVEMCNCSEPRFPTNGSACFTSEQNKCIRQVKAKFTAAGMDCVTKCPQPCLENVFSYTVSSAQWSKAFTATIRRKYLKAQNLGNAALASDNFLRLQIFYEDLSVAKMINEEAYKIENLLADIGGQLGLWIGCSVITFVELLDFIVNVLSYLLGKQKENKKLTTD
ncbi:acid-sensing ion channel 2-like isoform X1 [Oculina patagonica]